MMEERPNPNRSNLLRPFIEAMRSGRLTPVEAPEPPEPWETDALNHADPNIPWHALIRETHAWRELSEQDLHPPDETLPVHARLMDAATIGFAIAADLQRTVDEMILSGDMATAKKLSQLRNRFVREVNKLEEQVGDQNFDHCRDLGNEFAERAYREKNPEKESRESEETDTLKNTELGALLEEAHAAETTRSRQATFDKNHGYVEFSARKAMSKRKALPWMTGIVILLAAVWIVRIGLPMWSAPNVPVIDLAQLNHPAILYSEAVPPTIFVTLNGKEWAAMNADNRRDMIESTRALLEPAGYQGALFRTADGMSVGQWLKNTGVRLLEQSGS
jgi:hypothetical protein